MTRLCQRTYNTNQNIESSTQNQQTTNKQVIYQTNNMSRKKSVGPYTSLSPRANLVTDYDHHKRRMEEIRKTPRLGLQDQDNLAQIKTLQRWKNTAKVYETQKQQDELKKQNKQLLDRLWKISEGNHSHKHQKTFEAAKVNIKHRALSQKRFDEKVNEQNRILAKNLVQQSRNIKSKQQIKQEMQQYLIRRLKIRKVMLPGEMRQARKNLKLSEPDLRRLGVRSPRMTK